MASNSFEPLVTKLLRILDSLPAWSDCADFSVEEWERFKEAAKIFMQADNEAVEVALSEFVKRSIKKEYQGFEDESKPFILMRVVFELPDRIDVDKIQYFKGWNNWPKASKDKKVDLSWPVNWSEGYPKLVAPYEGSMGLPYAAAEEYRWFRQHFPFRSFRNPEDALRARNRGEDDNK